MPSNDELIDLLTEDLRPVRPVSPAVGRAIVAVLAVLTASALVAALGIRQDFATGAPHSVPLLAALLMLATGTAAAATVTAMARPAVGAMRNGWQWAVAALVVLPVAALMTAVGDSAQRVEMLPSDGLFCLIMGTVASLATITLLTLWLRRGATTSVERGSWLVGITGGAIGTFAIALICPEDAITHIGIWHVGIVALVAIGSRLILPRFLRW